MNQCSFLFLLSVVGVQSQDSAWLGGSKLSDQLSVAGQPGGRSGTGVWQDANGTVWMFGGMGMASAATTTGGAVLLNDVWRFTLANQTWSQLHPGTVSNLSVAVSSSPQIPRPRQLGAVCGTGNLMVLFGGLAENDQALGDLWVFDTAKKVWRMLVDSYSSGLDTQNATDKDTSPRDVGPAPRGDSVSWCTGTHLYVFGGTNASSFLFSDMWRLSLQDLAWEELQSSRQAPTSLKARRTADFPQGRNGAMSWVTQTDAQTALFMFGGNALSKYPRDRHVAAGFVSDMWQYTVATDSWRYISGFTQPGQPAVFSRLGETRASNIPGCRRGGAAWTDVKHTLWLFGGEGADEETPSSARSAKLLSDLWRFHPTTGEWVWMGGSRKGDTPASFRERGRATHTGTPGGRLDAAAWRELNGEAFFLFGGLGHDGAQRDGYLNDLWFIDVSPAVTYRFFVPAAYGFAVIFSSVAFVLCLVVVALYARDRSKPARWRRGDVGTRYSQLHDSDT